jgi:hypothetical protein
MGAGGFSTLGFNGYHADAGGWPDYSRPPVFMTASHCGGVGVEWGQDALSHPIGMVIHDAPVFFQGCPYAAGGQLADVAVGEYPMGGDQGYGVVYRTNGLNLNIIGTHSIGAAYYGGLTGDAAWKVGRTSGTSAGTIVVSCVDVPPSGGFPGLLCQQGAIYTAGGGDSGGAVYIPYSAGYPLTPRMLGIHHTSAGPTKYFSPMNNIWAAQSYQFFW